MKKLGRPKKSGPKKSHPLIAVVTWEELVQVKRYARAQKVSVGEVVRRALHKFLDV